MKKKIIYLITLILAVTLTVSCQKGPNLTMDDTWFLMDDSAILLLCEAPAEDKNYIMSVSNLKGNENELENVITELKKQGSDVKIQNAIGVAYLRSRQIDEAESVLLQALQNAMTEDERVCILTNLSETAEYKENDEEEYRYAVAADEACVTDPIKKLAVKSNLLKVQMKNAGYGAPYNAKVKHLLEEERRLLGSNRLIGIQNYKILALGCYYDDQLESGIKYMLKALELNRATYKNPSIEGDLYNTLSFIYFYQPNKEYDKEALKYANQYIDTLESWQTLDSYDLMNAYEWRGIIFLNMGDEDSALKDFQAVLNRTSKGQIMRGISYYNMGYIYMYQNHTEKAIDSFSKAYLILKKDSTEKDTINNIKQELMTFYDKDNKEKTGMSFEEWFSMQEMAAKRQLMKEGEK